MVSGECTYHVLRERHLTNRAAGTLLVARITQNGLPLSGQSETLVRILVSQLRHLLINIIGDIAWVSETLGTVTKLTPAGLDISIQIYITGDSTTRQSDDVSIAESGKESYETGEKSRFLSLFEDPMVQITSGSRPNLKYILQKEAELTVGRMGVTGLCYQLAIGPSLVADHEVNIYSMWFSICYCCGKRGLGLFSCWAVRHHEGRSQYYTSY